MRPEAPAGDHAWRLPRETFVSIAVFAVAWQILPLASPALALPVRFGEGPVIRTKGVKIE